MLAMLTVQLPKRAELQLEPLVMTATTTGVVYAGTWIQIGQLEALMELVAINPDKTASSFCLNLENCAELTIERPSPSILETNNSHA